MNQRDLVIEVNKHIEEWAEGAEKLVVAIDGYTGIGKTTLLDNLAQLNPNILPVHQDDFIVSRSVLEQFLNKSTDRSRVFELQNRDSGKIKHLIDLFRANSTPYTTKIFNSSTGEIDTEKTFDLSKKVLAIEGVFMFHPESLNYLWDKRIYLSGNLVAIDERRVKREKEKWGKDYFSEDHPDSFFRQVIVALNRYQNNFHPEKVADLVLTVD